MVSCSAFKSRTRNSCGCGTREAWADALAPQGFSRFYRDYGDTFYSALAVFARPADFDDFLAEGARGIV